MRLGAINCTLKFRQKKEVYYEHQNFIGKQKQKTHSVAHYNSPGVSKVCLSLHSSEVVRFEDHIVNIFVEVTVFVLQPYCHLQRANLYLCEKLVAYQKSHQ
mmetsp:Transcript_1374/g.2099  ORF Transcript_1374/g.2099 Transcript_1374/m.2099 type:complete len:101 (+) Transcript_1374:740-1042(+)